MKHQFKDGDGVICNSKEEVNELDDQSKRLEIAWDALRMVVIGLVEASYGCYWSFDLCNVDGDSKTLQKVFNTKNFYKENTCKVCQRGLMMLSQIRLGNSVDSWQWDKDEGSERNIKGFSIDSFLAMEKEYEHNSFRHPYNTHTQQKLANICCNVLINGDFNIADKTDYLIAVE
jgi:hypothetical protein